MIGSIRGTVLAKQPPALLIDVGGVGYEVEAPMSTFYDLPPVGSEVHLYTHLVVREDAQLLYGFATESERGAFRQLVKVSGIGPRLAVAILSGIDVAELVRCVQEQDIAQLVRLPGVGRKTAERLVVDLRDRIGAQQSGTEGGQPRHRPRGAPADDALSALLALGYREKEARSVLREIGDDSLTAEQTIRAALKRLVRA